MRKFFLIYKPLARDLEEVEQQIYGIFCMSYELV